MTISTCQPSSLTVNGLPLGAWPACVPIAAGVRLLKLTGSVPAGGVEGLRQFDDNRCQRQGAATARQWRKLSPSADVVIDTECAARRAIRDTGVAGADRDHWTITLFRGA